MMRLLTWRALALFIDLFVGYGGSIGIYLIVSQSLHMIGGEEVGLNEILAGMALGIFGCLLLMQILLMPLIYFPLLAGATGTTLGKKICGLRYFPIYSQRMGKKELMLRELYKGLTIFTGVGLLLIVLAVILSGRPWHEGITNISVEKCPKLTASQKRFRRDYVDSR
ncbi:RDD family protein [Planctomycetota bacterium]|nr:RDD family protein [Planctomycetota bacterium]